MTTPHSQYALGHETTGGTGRWSAKDPRRHQLEDLAWHADEMPWGQLIRTAIHITRKPNLFSWITFTDLCQAVRDRDALANGDLAWQEYAPDLNPGPDRQAVAHDHAAAQVEDLLDALLHGSLQGQR